MVVSTKGRYALRLMIDIANQGEQGTLVAMRQTAEREKLSIKYLEQLGAALVKAQVLKSVRGVTGGYMLARPADEISVGEILRATEGSSAAVSCIKDESSCQRSSDCGARDFWVGLNKVMRGYADKVTLAELTHKKSDVHYS